MWIAFLVDVEAFVAFLVMPINPLITLLAPFVLKRFLALAFLNGYAFLIIGLEQFLLNQLYERELLVGPDLTAFMGFFLQLVWSASSLIIFLVFAAVQKWHRTK